MEIWPYPYNVGKKAWLGTSEGSRTEQPNLSVYNTRDGVSGTSQTTSFSFQIYGSNETVRQTIGAVYIAVSPNTASWTLTYNTSKASGSATPFAVPNTNPTIYSATKYLVAPNWSATTSYTAGDIVRSLINPQNWYTATQAISAGGADPGAPNASPSWSFIERSNNTATDDYGKLVRYDRANVRSIYGTEINLNLTSFDPPGAAPPQPPILYYAYFTGHREMEYEGFRQIQETRLDSRLIVRENLYGGLNKSRLVNARRRWRTEYDVFISPNTPITFQQFYTFLRQKNKSDSFLFSEDFDLKPDRIYPAVITNTEEVFNYLNSTKRVFSIPLTIEEV